MNLLATIVAMQTDDSAQYWLALDWLILISIILLSFVMAWAIYRFWISGWVRNLRHPFNLRLFALTVGLGLFLTGGGSFAFEYKWQEWNLQTFIWILVACTVVWSVLLLLEYFQGRKVRY
jgi:hypothetical protein